MESLLLIVVTVIIIMINIIITTQRLVTKDIWSVKSRTENLKSNDNTHFYQHKSHIDVIHFHSCETSQGTGPHFPAEVGIASAFTCLPNDARDSYSRDSQDLWEGQGRWQAGFLRWCDSPSVSLSCWRVSK